MVNLCPGSFKEILASKAFKVNIFDVAKKTELCTSELKGKSNSWVTKQRMPPLVLLNFTVVSLVIKYLPSLESSIRWPKLTINNQSFDTKNTHHYKHELTIMLQPNTFLTFVVRRQEPELITPAVPTPRELKLLSDMDDQDGFRYQVPTIHFFPRNSEMEDKNPATVIREALAKLLVFYYPFAGRLKEGSGKKLMVDCTAEGALFIEAEADVSLEEFGERLHPPFPCIEELLYDVPGSSGILDSPLLLIQVTRLSCGGFIFASRMNHTLCDGQGAIQFLIALGEIARGASHPSILPVWQRELLFARDPPCVKFTDHPEYKEKTNSKDPHMKMDETMTQKTFFFRPSDVSALRRFVPDNIKSCSTYEVLTASIWRCRSIALEPNPEQEMRLMFPVNARAKLSPPLPIGYYGNCVVNPCVSSTARDLSNKPLAHALQLVMKAKSMVSEEFVRSTIDLLVIRGRPSLNFESTYSISNLTRVGFNEINFGWGKATYGGPAFGGLAFHPEVFSYLVSSTNNKGESGIMISISLPNVAMEKFIKELNKMLMPNKHHTYVLEALPNLN